MLYVITCNVLALPVGITPDDHLTVTLEPLILIAEVNVGIYGVAP